MHATTLAVRVLVNEIKNDLTVACYALDVAVQHALRTNTAHMLVHKNVCIHASGIQLQPGIVNVMAWSISETQIFAGPILSIPYPSITERSFFFF